ncbi:MAG: alpha-N-arabinofuranosidase, partial [Alphaproteobacteria bacterium]|nr:alpha-N-arabinofuranosidase [Alphaproteobacteria bacterium]
PYLKLAAVANEDGGLTVFALNRSLDQVLDLDAIAHGFAGLEVKEALTLRDENLDAANSRDDPDRLSPQPLQDVRFEGERLSAHLPPVSWNVLRLQETVG